jgi:hypothetical protein
LVAWKRESAPDLPFYNFIMKQRKGGDKTNATRSKRVNRAIDDASEDDELE